MQENMQENVQESTQETPYSWENPKIDLNLRHYKGSSSDVIKKIKMDIENFLSSEDVPKKTREIYSAIYCALDYYRTISYMPSPEFSTDETFLSRSIKTFNSDYDYLIDQFQSNNEEDLPVVSLSARVKSPLGFVNKVREKINEYVEKDRDLSYFTESLRDLLGIRIVVNPPDEIQKQGEQAESDFLYQVTHSLMEKHGIFRDNPIEGDFKFIPVNTRHNPNKLQSIKNRKGFTECIANGIVKIFIPQNRIIKFKNKKDGKEKIINFDDKRIDSVLKDYNRWPKFSGYQSIHMCIIPDYSKDIEMPKLPPCILPQKINDFAIEYQIRTAKQDDFAENGPASHRFSYKPQETRYHRLAVPLYIEHDMLTIPKDSTIDTSQGAKLGPLQLHKVKLKLKNFAQSFEKFYHHSFKNRFNIDFAEFRDRFSFQDRNDILAGVKTVHFDSDKGVYELLDEPNLLLIDPAVDTTPYQLISGVKEDVDIVNLFDEKGFLDSTKLVTQNQEGQTTTTTCRPTNVKVYSVETSEQRQAKEKSKIDSPDLSDSSTTGNPHTTDDDDFESPEK